MLFPETPAHITYTACLLCAGRWYPCGEPLCVSSFTAIHTRDTRFVLGPFCKICLLEFQSCAPMKSWFQKKRNTHTHTHNLHNFSVCDHHYHLVTILLLNYSQVPVVHPNLEIAGKYNSTSSFLGPSSYRTFLSPLTLPDSLLSQDAGVMEQSFWTL